MSKVYSYKLVADAYRDLLDDLINMAIYGKN